MPGLFPIKNLKLGIVFAVYNFNCLEIHNDHPKDASQPGKYRGND
jgi:hypothetical protein